MNPHMDSTHSITRSLQRKGVALLLPSSPGEAVQMLSLHGTSVDLAILHRESLPGYEPVGIRLIGQIKKDPAQADLPILITTEKWSDAECAAHQKTPSGANAYLRYPFTETQLVQLIEAVTGQSLASKNTGSGIIVAEPGEVIFETQAGNVRGIDLAQGPTPEPPVDALSLATPSQVSIPTANTVAELPSVLLEAPVSEENPGGAPAGGSDDSIQIELGDPLAPASEPGVALGELPTDGAPVAELPPMELPLTGVTVPSYGAEPSIGSAAQDEEQLAQELPYLFSRANANAPVRDTLAFVQPQGDAVVPGGAAQSPDTETLKKYLLLREQDVAALSAQLKTMHEQLRAAEETLRSEQGRSGELVHTVEEQKRKIAEFEREKNLALEALQSEIAELRFQMKAKGDKARLLESQVREATGEMERLKERVRSDIRKIRVREKELENRLEIMKKDAEALIGARENKIIELKRKLDLLEFNMDLLQDKYTREKENANRLRERLAKAAQAVRVAGGVLDPQIAAGTEPEPASGAVDDESSRAVS